MNNSVLTHRPLIPALAVTRQNARATDNTSNRNALLIAAFLLVHIPLGLVVHRFPALATVHAFVVFAIGLRWALMSPPDLYRVACVGAYIAGAEVLWRMTEAQIFWEYGKYATVVLFIVALVRSGRVKGNLPMFLYFALLIPSAVMILFEQGLVETRGQLSFNMSGPLALMTAVWFFSNLKLTREQLERLFVTLICPLMGVAFLTLFVTVTTEDIRFIGDSNKEMSAGFGPNQVASALGLGFLIALLSLLISERSQILRVLLFLTMIFLGVQSMMTFSRGGMYSAIGASIVVTIFLVRDSRTLFKLIAVAALVLIIGVVIVLPRANEFTGGALLTRFQDTDTTGRESLFELDLQLWFDNPILGVGPGEAMSYRQDHLGKGLTAHTEFSRLVAEHGVFGLLALLMLLVAGTWILWRARDARQRALMAAMMAWSFLYMTNAAMRLVAPAFMFGLGFITFLSAEYPVFKKAQRVNKKIVKPPYRSGATRSTSARALTQSSRSS